jgi:hypothetical protein
MPFSQLIPRRLLAATVKAHAPSASGVYGISNAREWIYIGETNDIQGALLDHLEQMDSPLMQRQPTGFVYELCDRPNRWSRQDRLVSEYAPCGNQGVQPGRV